MNVQESMNTEQTNEVSNLALISSRDVIADKAEHDPNSQREQKLWAPNTKRCVRNTINQNMSI